MLPGPNLSHMPKDLLESKIFGAVKMYDLNMTGLKCALVFLKGTPLICHTDWSPWLMKKLLNWLNVGCEGWMVVTGGRESNQKGNKKRQNGGTTQFDVIFSPLARYLRLLFRHETTGYLQQQLKTIQLLFFIVFCCLWTEKRHFTEDANWIITSMMIIVS